MIYPKILVIVQRMLYDSKMQKCVGHLMKLYIPWSEINCCTTARYV